MTATVDAIRLCIDRCAGYRDGRGPWQAKAACRTVLARSGSATIADVVAESARRIGTWLRTAEKAR